jgi:uncharacterized repeat protein (TIGR03847 family)
MGHEYELREVTFITVGTVGPPGQRVFHLQAGKDAELVTLIIEKEQAAALSQAVTQLMDELDKTLELPAADPKVAKMDMNLHEPILPAFRVGQLGLAYEEDSGLVMVAAQELVLEGEDEDPSVARLYATRDQMVALSEHAMEVVHQGRPICPMCGRPEDPDGHFCPKRNGHGERASLA